jgi:GntR family transcriptional repressor for pyruvate dehydrogenase complex
MADRPAEHDDRQSAVDTVIGHMRELIRTQGLRVGDVLPSEVEMGAMFDASRNTGREAVRTLKAYGVVESRKKVGAVLIDGRQIAMSDLFAFAMEISADTFRDIQGFRRLTEMNLADRLAGRMPVEELERMARINRDMDGAVDVGRASELDFLFHQALVDAAGNRTLSEIYAMLKPVICRLMGTGKSRREVRHAAATEHANIIEALRVGDRIAFVYHMDRHLDAGLEFIEKK